MILIDEKEVSNAEYIQVVNNYVDFDSFVIGLFNIHSVYPSTGALAPVDTVLSCLLSYDKGNTVKTDAKYSVNGLSIFNPEGIAHVDYAPNSISGIHVGVDAGDVEGHGTSGFIWFQSPGTVSGRASYPGLVSMTRRGVYGGEGIGTIHNGHYSGNAGNRVNGWRFSVDRVGTDNYNISGKIKLYCIE